MRKKNLFLRIKLIFRCYFSLGTASMHKNYDTECFFPEILIKEFYNIIGQNLKWCIKLLKKYCLLRIWSIFQSELLSTWQYPQYYAKGTLGSLSKSGLG